MYTCNTGPRWLMNWNFTSQQITKHGYHFEQQNDFSMIYWEDFQTYDIVLLHLSHGLLGYLAVILLSLQIDIMSISQKL